MPPGPERRHRDDDRSAPYRRDDERGSKPLPGPPGAPDAATQQAITQAAIQAAAMAAAQAAAAAAQQHAAAGGAQPARGGGAPLPAHVPGQPYFVKVSAGSNPKGVAGKVCHTCREGDAPAMLTIGSSCINQAVKAICISRGYLAKDNNPVDLTFQTAFREGGTPDKPSVALYLAKHPITWVPTPNTMEMQVSANSNPQVVAGALAARVREGSVPCLTAIGVDAVANCVLAIGHTRLYLEQDQKDIRARPEFIHVLKNGEDWNAIKFHIHVDNI